ncbi:probable RPN2-26S proteasome regulatory subunit [Sporisorium reilianum f. sp. reilianum]|uniref:26S proteasome regulatory subunit RPN2 n=1 Tax=Sporisorium reilianum f. sp. reilianum TaxID=72559 RepID=A0A2N8UKR8_9BASI|nr:probable RPN2-26S proteasome regulatory subunit [Sporisorium reilianum f. sp. reilianum]
MVAPVTSAAGIVALLDEQEPELQSYALKRLDSLVHQFWAEIADAISKIEILYEDERFPDRKLAALVASKIYFHLGEHDEALMFALGAGPLFDVDVKDEYVDTVVSKAIDRYIQDTTPATAATLTPDSDTAASKAAAHKSATDPRLKSIVDQMFARCISDKEYKQALGIALETQRLDIIEQVYSVTHDADLLTYVLESSVGVVPSIEVRNQILHLLVKLFQRLPSPDHFSIGQCYVYLNAPNLASELLFNLIKQAHQPSSSSQANTPHDPLLVTYQLAFDLAESATQEFLENMRRDLSSKASHETPAVKAESADADTDMNGATASDATTVSSCIERVRSILQGEESIQLYLEFLKRSNKADLPILKATKEALDARSSIYHSALSFANAFMNAGTTSDKFLRENLEWLAKASNWSKFTATAALGILNKGNLKEGISILRPYLPQDGVTSSVYSEGGSLFALGLIHANHGAEVMELLTNTLKSNPAEIVQHGAALGLGAAGMATGNEEVYEELRNVLYTDSAVAGEASGYAMGLVMLGTGSERAVEEMLQYAHETQHEKIIRGLAIGISLLFYGKEEKAEAMIDTLLADKDAILRYGGVYTIALAYAGTANNKAIRRLLHIAVSDVSDDVRRAAVTSLGFLLFRNPTQVPRIVQLLSESYNPHVRYGSTLALGIACAGTGLNEAVDLLEPMTKDPVDFVRQGACIALAMIFIQQNEALNPRVNNARKTFDKIISDKHEDAMAKFGAALAQGLIDAGGRNVTISLQSRGGNANMPAIVGMALFTQFWYWFPLAHFSALAFTPTALIGLNRELRIPEFEFVSEAKPSLFAYPTSFKPPSEKKVERVETAVLSTTVKAQARQRNKERERAQAEGGADAMDVDDASGAAAAAGKKEDGDVAMDEDTAKTSTAAKAGKPKKERKQEPRSELLPNYSRVTPAQVKFVTFPPESRFVPIRPVQGLGSKVRQDVYNTSSVAGKLLGNASPAPGASGTVTPSHSAAAGVVAGVKSLHQQAVSNAAATAGGETGAAAAAAAAPGTAGSGSGPTAEQARSILTSAIGGTGGILLMVDRKPHDEFRALKIGDSSDDDGTTSTNTQRPAGEANVHHDDDEISPEDAAAIAAAMAADDDERGDDKEINSVAGHQTRRDGDGDGGAGNGGVGGGLPEAR